MSGYGPTAEITVFEVDNRLSSEIIDLEHGKQLQQREQKREL